MVVEKTIRHVLRRVDEGLYFHFCNGHIARDIHELLAGVEGLNPEQYDHHVYFDHNDFANWLIDVIDDPLLARDIYNANQRKTIALMQARIHYLVELVKEE
jgi:hypothetical protein